MLENLHVKNLALIDEQEITFTRGLNILTGETLRLVRIGDYDVCPCIGKHVRSTAQIGKFVLLGTNWDEHAHSLRIRFKIVQ